MKITIDIVDVNFTVAKELLDKVEALECSSNVVINIGINKQQKLENYLSDTKLK